MPSFEDSLKKLESIVDQLEKGDLALEESLKLFEEGVGLSAACKAELDAAEGKVQMLVKQRDGSLKPEPFLAKNPSEFVHCSGSSRPKPAQANSELKIHSRRGNSTTCRHATRDQRRLISPRAKARMPKSKPRSANSPAYGIASWR